MHICCVHRIIKNKYILAKIETYYKIAEITLFYTVLSAKIKTYEILAENIGGLS